jgi:phosphate transport system substrate-binding protein
MQQPAVFEHGDVVGGGYRVARLVDRGGMGSVYEVVQLATGARRALKVMHVQLASDPKLRARFVREARVAANISSDHVADVIDAGVDERTNLPFLVMELLEGATLARELRRRGYFDWASAREIFRQLAHAVAAAHAAGIVHRDLKPANIFLARARTAGLPFVVKVLDFGIAEVVASAQSGSAAIIGTPRWMAPEQTDRNAPIGPAADVWAMGLIAFSLFTGQPYWARAASGTDDSSPTDEVLTRLSREEIVAASTRAASYGVADRLPPEFDAWFARSNARDPNDRFADASEAFTAFGEMMAMELGGESKARSLLPLAMDDALAATIDDDVSTHAPTRPIGARARAAPVMGRIALAAVVLAGLSIAAWSASRPSGVVVGKAAEPAAASTAPPLHVLARVHGSNTIGAELAPALAEAFLAREVGGGTPFRKHLAADEMLVVSHGPDGTDEAIEIEAHGSSTAFKDLESGACDIGMASRRIRPDEIAALAAKGGGKSEIDSPANEHVIALDGIAVVVNPANPVARLSTEQLARIFSGDAARWSDVGGSDAPIAVYARDDRSGTFDTFKSLVLAGKPLTAGARRFESSEALADSVAGDANGIGFVGLAYVRSAKPVMVQEASSAPMLPSATTVATEDYPLSRRLYFYSSPSADEDARRFVDFALSDSGQAVVARAGFVDLRPECDPNARDHAGLEGWLRAALGSACRLSVDLRFDSASQQLDTRALRDLQRLGGLLARGEYAGRRLALLGFSDGQGRRADNVALSLARASVVADQLRARGLGVELVRGLGPVMPVADDASEAGRQRNRRVEIWLL